MYFDSPQVTDFTASLPVAESAYPRTKFWRTIAVLALHGVAQLTICISAQVDSRQTQDFCTLLTCVSTFIHIILLCSFAGMVIRSRFLFSWSFGVAILSFCFSLLLCYLMVGHRNNEFLGPMFGVAIAHFFILCAAGICLMFWPIFRWPYELTRDITDEISQPQKIPLQFGLKRMLYITLIVALASYCLSHANKELFARRPTNEFFLITIPVIAAFSPFINIYLILRPRFSILQLIHINIWFWITIVLLYLWGTEIPSPPWGGIGPQWTGPNPWGVNREFIMYTEFFFGATAHLFISAFLYRWAGWRIVRFAGHNQSVYKRIYRYIMSSH